LSTPAGAGELNWGLRHRCDGGLETVHAKAADASAHDLTPAQAQEYLNPEIREQWRDWDAPIWIDGAIERFYDEAKVPAKLP
jgi:hypothetical protein